jgi:hypothetical protein
LFDFGVERVCREYSQSHNLFGCIPNQACIFTDWHNDIPVIEGCVLNVKNLLDEENIAY